MTEGVEQKQYFYTPYPVDVVKKKKSQIGFKRLQGDFQNLSKGNLSPSEDGHRLRKTQSKVQHEVILCSDLKES